jgi:hypothetical protein
MTSCLMLCFFGLTLIHLYCTAHLRKGNFMTDARKHSQYLIIKAEILLAVFVRSQQREGIL